MITLKNLETEYPNIDQAILPTLLKQNEFDYIIKNMYLYGNAKAENTTKLIDTFVLKLNEIAAKQTKKEPSKLKIVKSKKQLSKGRKKLTRAASKKRVKVSPKKNEQLFDILYEVGHYGTHYYCKTFHMLPVSKSIKDITQSGNSLVDGLRSYMVTELGLKQLKKDYNVKYGDKQSFSSKSLIKPTDPKAIIKEKVQKSVFTKMKNEGYTRSEDNYTPEFKKRVNDIVDSKINEPEALPKTVGKKQIKKGRKLTARKTASKRPIKAIISKPQTIKKPKMKTEKQSKKQTFTSIPSWLSVIRKFAAMANKEFSQATLRTFLKTIQTSFNANKNGNTPHVDLIRNIQMTIVTSVNEQIKLSKIKLKANAGLVAKCKEVSKAYSIKKRLPSTVPVEVKALSGLQGIIPSTELAGMEFQTLPFTGKFQQLIGNPTKPFQIMVYGLPGSGKSTLAIQFAKYLAESHNLKVLYLAKEEGISGTSQEKFMRLNAIHEYISITEKMPSDISNFDVLMIDSVNEMNMTPDDIRAIQTKYPKLSTVQLFKATKEGKFLGASDFAHLCQAEIRCLDGKAQAQKNRFGGNVEVRILE